MWELADLSFVLFFSGLFVTVTALVRYLSARRDSAAPIAYLIWHPMYAITPGGLILGGYYTLHHVSAPPRLARIRWIAIGVALMLTAAIHGGIILEIYTNIK